MDTNRILSENLDLFLSESRFTAKAFVDYANENKVPLDYSHFTRVLNVFKRGSPTNITLAKLDSIVAAINLVNGYESMVATDLLMPNLNKASQEININANLRDDYIKSVEKFIITIGQLGWCEIKSGVQLSLLADVAWKEFKETDSGCQYEETEKKNSKGKRIA